ncbi:FluG domain-containing protein [Dactylonectria estremocensis]|uniref:FluG domain-containing protein n=1 Tax=Dactylonectria estremocensis TaxID=1079267 RepID=A0A9P9D144_9HYPO|nr:FluG domain-containing protein [Dactylonectria estremocensis]
MARRPLHQDIDRALQNAAQKWHRKSQLRKEEHQQKLDSTGYQALRKQLNQTSFLPPLDADNTRANTYYIKKRFMKFCWSCNQNKCRQWKFAIKASNCDKGLIMSFLHWICETYVKPRRKRSKKKTINQYWRDFKMLYRRVNKGKLINGNDCQEVVKYINGTLKPKFNLDDLPKSKPVMGVDDLLWGLTHHWARDRSVFPTEDDRLDVPTIMLFQAYSACRPAELVDGTKSRGREDPLREEAGKLDPTGNKDDSILFDDDDGSGYNSASTDDTEINDDTIADANDHEEEAEKLAQQEADHQETEPSGGRDVLVMEVYLRYHKGADNKPKPTVFLFREHPLPMLCPISHILARAIRDDAIQVNGYSSAEPFFSTKLGKGAVKVHWKPCKLKIPVFRKSVRTASGAWQKSETEPMKYATYAFYLDRIGMRYLGELTEFIRYLGSEEKWTSYCLRRGNANALLGKAPDAVVDQVMRHDPMTGCLQNAYLNHRVGFNTQYAFLEEEPSDDGLTRAFTHMSIRCNPEVPKEIPKAELDRLPTDPDIDELSRRVKRMSIDIRHEYKFIRLSPLENAEKNFRDEMTRVYQEACRRRLHDEELERQLNGMAADSEVEPMIEHHLQERTQLQGILCDFNRNPSLQDITDRKVRGINLMVSLASRREIRRPHPNFGR